MRYANSTLPPTWDKSILALPSPSRPNFFKALWRFLMVDSFQTKKKTNVLSRENKIWHIVKENRSTEKVCWRHDQIKHCNSYLFIETLQTTQGVISSKINHDQRHNLWVWDSVPSILGFNTGTKCCGSRSIMRWSSRTLLQQLHNAVCRCFTFLPFFQAKLQVTIPFIG